MNSVKKLLTFVVSLISVVNADAQDSTKTLSAIVVTANKYPLKQDETIKVVAIITQEQLQRSLARSVGEVLNEQVGVVVSGANNTPGTNQSVYMRGASSANTLILLDGVPLYDPAGISGEFDLNNFSVHNIERIEILKGAQSTLYGSDAVAGVINIITKKSAEKPLQISATSSAGSYDSYRAAVAFSGKLKGFDYAVGYNKHISGGISAAHDSSGKRDFENDGFKQHLLHASLGFNLIKNLDSRVYGKYNLNRTDIDAGAFTDDHDYRLRNKNLILGSNLVYSLPSARINLLYNFNRYDRFLRDDSSHVGGSGSFFSIYQDAIFKARSHFAELYSNISLHKKVDLLAGVDYRRNSSDQSYSSISNFGPFTSKPLAADSIKTYQYSGYASLMVKNISGFYFEAGSRWNNHSVYGENITYSFGSSYLIKEFKLFANYSSGYRVPSLYQLYSEFGNTDLDPETSINAEAGIEVKSRKISSRVVGFIRRIKDVFTFYTDPATFASKYINDDLQKDKGVEVEFSFKPSNKFSISSNYTYVDGKITTDNGGKDTTFFNLYRRPRNSFHLNIGYRPIPDLFFSTSLRITDKMYEPVFGAAPIEMKGFHTINFYTEYNYRKTVKLFADFRNVTNQKYFEVRGFNSRRFNVEGGVSILL
jgi:vitamin B12 transporter